MDRGAWRGAAELDMNERVCARAHTHTHVTSLDWHKPPLALFRTNPAPDKAAPLSSEPPHPDSSCSSLLPSLFIPSLISCPRRSPSSAAFPWLAFVCQVRLPHLPAALTISFALSLQAWGLLSSCWGEQALSSSSQDDIARPPLGPSGGPSRTQPLSQVPSQPSSLGEA